MPLHLRMEDAGQDCRANDHEGEVPEARCVPRSGLFRISQTPAMSEIKSSFESRVTKIPNKLIFTSSFISLGFPNRCRSTTVDDCNDHPSGRSIDYTINPELKPEYRHILTSWLLEVSESYKLGAVAHQKATSLIDRYLSSHSIPKNKLQSLGVSALYMASRNFSDTPLTLSEAEFVGDGTCPPELILQHEQQYCSVFAESELWNHASVSDMLTACYRGVYSESVFVSLVCDFLADLCTCDSSLHKRESTELADSIIGIALTLNKFRNNPELYCGDCWKSPFMEGSVAWQIERAVTANRKELRDRGHPEYRANRYIGKKHRLVLRHLGKCGFLGLLPRSN